jgi:hypothetical protein
MKSRGVAPLSQAKSQGTIMTYRVYTGPPGTTDIPAAERSRWLYKEFNLLDDALGWARFVNKSSRVTLLIEGDDGTHLERSDVNTELRHLEHDAVAAREVN